MHSFSCSICIKSMDLAILICVCISFIENFFINSLPTSDICCYLLLTFANCLYQDQACQSIGHDIDPNSLTLTIFLKEFFEKVYFEKKIQPMTKKAIKITQHAVCQVDHCECLFVVC